MSAARRLAAFSLIAFLTVVLAATLLPSPDRSDTGRPIDTALEEAANTADFEAGNIISDVLFFDSATMSAGEIQNFLNLKGANCRPGTDGSPCLKDYRQDTASRSADSLCRGGYTGAAAETAATIIHKVARGCGINPQVLMVMLQKEQSLLTASGSYLTAGRYRIAMGYGCPDTAACDTQYYGFHNQVYSAARQFQNYVANPTRYGHRAGIVNQVRYSPNEACGSSSVYIHTKATAALYNYTPYQPNGAALAAGYGVGDSCSAYGNRNFWLYFTDWFGRTSDPSVSGGIRAVWEAQGMEAGPLGRPVTAMVCGLEQSGCAQHFQGGSIYWTSATGAHSISGAVRATWAHRGWQAGSLGYPVMGMVCGLRNDGCAQHFQGGSIYWTAATGARVSSGAVRDAWAARGWQDGALGYPVTDVVCGLRSGGCAQHFEGSSVYWTAGTGARTTHGKIREAWAARGWQDGPVGYPTADLACGLSGGGCTQRFQGGILSWSPDTGTVSTSGGIAVAWTAAGAESGSLGYPKAEMICGLRSGGCAQTFQGGLVVWSPTTPPSAVSAGTLDLWKNAGRENGYLGYPTSSMACGLVGGGCLQTFQGGVVTWSPATGTHALSGGIAAFWTAAGRDQGSLGYPHMVMACGLRSGGCAQHFQGGSAYWSPATGVWMSSGVLRDVWAAQGWQDGDLAYPVDNGVCGTRDNGCVQRFQGGFAAWSAGTGAHAVTGGFSSYWAGSGRENGPLAYPTGPMTCNTSGCTQPFQSGTLFWDRAAQRIVVR